MATILYMMTLSVAEARATFSKLVESASTTHERFEVTRNGRRAAVILGADDFDALLETIAILGDSDLVKSLREGLASETTVSADEVRAAMHDAGRVAP
jgi:prevent-host-death family protein